MFGINLIIDFTECAHTYNFICNKFATVRFCTVLHRFAPFCTILHICCTILHHFAPFCTVNNPNNVQLRLIWFKGPKNAQYAPCAS